LPAVLTWLSGGASRQVDCQNVCFSSRGFYMLTSARNQLTGKVSAIHSGVVNDEVEITLAGGERIVAIITRESTRSLGLIPGKEALALIKASWVILSVPESGIRLSTRNRLEGVVRNVHVGAVNTSVEIGLSGGDLVTAMVTQDSALSLGLAIGKPVVAYFKASHVIVGVKG
jgi:molybdate transport system regulatory protein